MGPTQDAQISRKALGRGALLGALYDARTDRFTGANLFHDVPSAAISAIDTHGSALRMDFLDTAQSQTDLLSVEAQLSGSLLAFSLGGSGAYLKSRKNSAKTVRGSLLYQITTTHTTLNL